MRHHVNKSRSIPEVFDKILEQESNEVKIQMLKAYDTKALRWVINAMYNVDWSDMKVPTVKQNNRPSEICNMSIGGSIKRLEVAYHNRIANPKLTDKNLTIILEEVSAREAELLLDIFAGRKVKGISKTVFKKAYPQFFRSEETD